jgi:peptidyl-prolyl cis-trans isomerase A (cyclophilin A)
VPRSAYNRRMNPHTRVPLSRALLAVCAAATLWLLACSKPSESGKEAEQKASPPAEAPKAPEADQAPALFKVRFDTSKGPVVIEVHKDWAPIGAQQFYKLAKAGFFDGARFFRIVPNFVVQFGLAADPATTRKWNKEIKDDPVMQTNKAGSLAFATRGPNTRTTQIFINLRSNQSLDGQGFAPFATVTEGMGVVEHFYAGYGEQPDQGAIESRGNAYLEATFPKLDYIRKATVE